MRIVFMGTPDFAGVCLDRLVEEKADIVGVFTQPDKPVGRKRVITPPDVKVRAIAHGLPVFQPSSIKTEESYNQLCDLNPDLIAVVAYGQILPKGILDIPKYGCVNVHASLLPKYRGASPIQWAIVCGESETGVTTMLMNQGMDTGDILLSGRVEIAPDTTADKLWGRLAKMGSDLLIKTIEKLKKDEINPKKQENSLATYAPIIKKSDGLIDWNCSAKEIDCLVRGLCVWPVAHTHISGRTLKIFSVKIVRGSGTPGEILSKSGELIIACGSGALRVEELQAEGGKRMSADEFLRGAKIEVERL